MAKFPRRHSTQTYTIQHNVEIEKTQQKTRGKEVDSAPQMQLPHPSVRMDRSSRQEISKTPRVEQPSVTRT